MRKKSAGSDELQFKTADDKIACLRALPHSRLIG